MTDTDSPSLGLIVSRSPNPTDAIDKAGVWFAKSGLFGCDRVEQGAILALTCMSENISPVEFSRTYDICEGKLRKKAMAAFAEFRKRGGKVKWVATGDDGVRAEADFTFEGQTVRLSFTIDQAKQAGLIKDRSGWIKNPSNMLRARLISNALGMLCPEIYAGSYDDDDERAGSPAPQREIVLEAVPHPNPPIRLAAAADTPEMSPEPAPTVSLWPSVAPPAAAAAAVASPTATGGPLSVELQEKIVAAIGADRIGLATSYCQKVGWLGPGDSLEFLPAKRAKQILSRVERFIQAITEPGA